MPISRLPPCPFSWPSLTLCLLTLTLWTLPVRADLTPDITDPLLPETSQNRPLSTLEKEQLRGDMDNLHQQALELLGQGNSLEAFELWQRELNLRRVLGAIDEVPALGRVGNIAWSEGESGIIREIITRLDLIQNDVDSADIPILQELARAYQQVRSPQSAIAVYQNLLNQAIAESDRLIQAEMLDKIAQTHLNWFDYGQAIQGFQSVLQLAQKAEEFPTQVKAYQQLAYCYEEILDLESAIETRLALIELSYQLGEVDRIPSEQIAIANYYQTLGKLKTAAQLYEKAYFTAFELQHLGQASMALKQLGQLYQNQEQWPQTLAVYRSLLAVQAQGYDAYGMMNTYEKIAQVHTTLGEGDRALIALERGLKLAQQLNLEPNYFLNLIEHLGDRSS